jgi:serine protease AprX
MRPEFTSRTPGERSNALWGKGTRGNEARSNTLRGKAGRGAVTLAVLAFAFVVPMAGSARTTVTVRPAPFVPTSLISQARANPNGVYKVIVQGLPSKRNNSKQIATYVTDQIASDGKGGHLKRTFLSISGVSANLTGKQILHLSKNPHIQAITSDVAMASMSESDTSIVPDSSMWRASTDVTELTELFDPLTGMDLGPAPDAPTIAIVDSGIDSSNNDFGARVLASVNFSSLDPTGTGDPEGHGTMVAGLAASSSEAYPGAAPTANLVDLRTADSSGESVMSDVIAASDWILAHKAQYNIKVANFSMSTANPVSFRYDPLDQAVERLWFAGVTVVAAAGNGGTGNGPVDMSHAPGNDPFVITVGALDQNETADPSDDTVPWWSAYGDTMDGFSKPDIAAPGRYMVSAVPMGSTLATTAPDRVVAPGYMWMSGTSFAAPIVSGAVAEILAQHPDWTPDEVKGALMLTAADLPNVDNFTPNAAGVGEVDGGTAASLDFTPPNPNENLYDYVVTDPATGSQVFDQAAWSSDVANDASWSSAAWSSAAWSSAAWNSAAWNSAAWNSAAWSSDVNSAMASLASWSSASWSSSTWDR